MLCDDDRMATGGEEGSATTAVIRVTRRAADRLRGGHLWVYRTDLEGDSSSLAPGALVTVTDTRGIALGSGTYSTASTIAVRIVSSQPGLARDGLLRTLRERVEAALARRETLAPLSPATDARRLLFSEADGVPGIVADQYGNVVIVQLLTQGTAAADVRALLAELLPRACASRAGEPVTVWERTDARMRELEELPQPPAEPLFSTPGMESVAATVFHLHGLGFHYDVAAGQKTGAFLDQRFNYAAAAGYAHGRALDVCTYHGGFALHLARRCERITGVDASRSALEVADRNLELNQASLTAEVDWIEADAFDLLRAWDQAGERFDTIVLDPPAFAKSRRATEGALRGYKELNLRALRMLRSGGILVTCSCSHHVPLADFTAMLASATTDSRRHVQLLETRGAAPDHPAILTLPETTYLKCLICRVD